jgi:hypothetical protein
MPRNKDPRPKLNTISGVAKMLVAAIPADLWTANHRHAQDLLDALRVFSNTGNGAATVCELLQRQIKASNTEFFQAVIDLLRLNEPKPPTGGEQWQPVKFNSVPKANMEPLKAFFFENCYDHLGRQTFDGTFNDLLALAKTKGFALDPRHFRRVCRDFGVEWRKSKGGRPRETGARNVRIKRQ